MKKVAIYLFLAMCVSCSTNGILKETYSSTYSNVKFIPTERTQTIQENISLTIEPIDATALNQDIVTYLSNDGAYEKATSRYQFQDEKLLEFRKTDEEKSRQRFKAAIELLEKKGEIDNVLALTMKELIYKVKSEMNNEEYYNAGNKFSQNDIFNPYRVGEKHLSLYKLSFVNNGEMTQTVNIKNFQILSKNELLFPLRTSYFESLYKADDSRLIDVIYRINMPDSMCLLPKAKVVKYIAGPAINVSNDALNIDYVKDKKETDFSFKVEPESQKEVKTFDGFKLNYPANVVSPIIVIKMSNGDFVTPINNIFYVNEKDLNKEITVYAIASFGYGVGFYKKNIIPANITDNTLKLTFSRVQ